YTHDYLVLATDAIAATREARRLAGARAASIGYQAGSQGGWVAPLAARIEPVDFVVVSFGLAVSPLEEDRAAVVLDMERHGFGPRLPGAGHRRHRRHPRSAPPRRRPRREHRLPGRQPGRLGRAAGRAHRTGGLRGGELRPGRVAAGGRPRRRGAGHGTPRLRP